MGKTAMSGPVYGAKSLLWNYGPYTGTSSGGTTAIFNANAIRVVPAYEDWYITEMFLTCSTNSSVASGHGFYLKSEGGSTVVPPRPDGKASTVAQTVASLISVLTGNSTTYVGSTTPTPTAGEYEGVYVPAGSTLRFVSSGITLAGGVQLNVMGYIRYIDSTRAS